MEERVSLMRMEAEISAILAMLQEVKEQTVGKVYNTQAHQSRWFHAYHLQGQRSYATYRHYHFWW